MDLIQKPQGYPTHQISHQNPIPTLPALKTLHDKKDSTLLEMVMKGLLKQRIYGRVENFNKNNINNKNHIVIMTARENVRDDDNVRRYQDDGDVKLREQRQNGLMKYQRMYSVRNSDQKFDKRKIDNLNGLKRKEYMRNGRVTILQQKKGRQQVKGNNVRARMNKSEMDMIERFSQLQHQHQHQHQVSNNRRYDEMSFISAIDIEVSSNDKKVNKSIPDGIRLPQISSINHKRFKQEKQQQKQKQKQDKNKVILKKYQNKKLLVDDNLWDFLSKKNISNKMKRMTSHLNKSDSIKDSINIINTMDIDKSTDTKQPLLSNSIEILIFQKAKNSPSQLNRQSYINFAKSTNFNIPLFFQSISQFFQLTTKIQDRIKKEEFEGIISTIYMQNSRAWAVAVFRFLDQNRDGLIDSTDLFKIYNHLEQLRLKNQTYVRNISQNCQAHHDNINNKGDINHKNDKIALIKRSINRQTTEISQISNISKTQRQNKRQRKASISSRISSQQVEIDQNKVISQQIQKNIQYLMNFKKQIENLNKRIVKCEDNNTKDFNNPQRQVTLCVDKQSKPSKNDPKLTYSNLQEVLLTRQQLKFSQLSLILHLTQQPQLPQKKKNIIDIDKQKLHIKLSSMYMQTFSAMDHNEQTRYNREYLQSLKDSLKRIYLKYEDMGEGLENKMLSKVKYTEFLEEGLYLPFKEIFFRLLHAQYISNEKQS